MNKGQSLQDPFLNALRKERMPVSIDSFDQFVLVLKNTVNQMVYKHAISTIVPARLVKIPHEDTSEQKKEG